MWNFDFKDTFYKDLLHNCKSFDLKKTVMSFSHPINRSHSQILRNDPIQSFILHLKKWHRSNIFFDSSATLVLQI